MFFVYIHTLSHYICQAADFVQVSLLLCSLLLFHMWFLEYAWSADFVQVSRLPLFHVFIQIFCPHFIHASQRTLYKSVGFYLNPCVISGHILYPHVYFWPHLDTFDHFKFVHSYFKFVLSFYITYASRLTLYKSVGF